MFRDAGDVGCGPLAKLGKAGKATSLQAPSFIPVLRLSETDPSKKRLKCAVQCSKNDDNHPVTVSRTFCFRSNRNR